MEWRKGSFSARSNNSGGRGSWTKSDSESWRRKEVGQAGDMRKKIGEEKEVTSPLKLPEPRVTMTNNKKKLEFPDGEMVCADHTTESTGEGEEFKEGGREGKKGSSGCRGVVGSVGPLRRPIKDLGIYGGS